VPNGPPFAGRDSGGSPANAAVDPTSRGSTPTKGLGAGAPIAPSGLTIGDRVANTPQIRDSIAREMMGGVPGLARTHEPTGRERQELEQSQRQAAVLRQRTTTAGNSRDLVILQGAGKDGVGAVTGPGVVSVGAPLFSSGPSAEQRRKNEKIDADYQLRLRRLEDRALLKRDSIRADSLHADSLRHDAIAKRRIPLD
jgi:hypothetical protein